LIVLAALIGSALAAFGWYLANEIDGGVPGNPESLLLASLASACGALVLSVLIVVRLARRTAEVATATQAIADGDFSKRVHVESSISGSTLGHAFNRMAGGLEDLVAAADEERRRLTAALDSGLDAVVALDADGAVAYANRAATELLKRPMDELMGSALGWLLPNDEVIAALRSSRDERLSRTLVIEHAPNEWLRVAVAPILGDGGWSALVVIHDLSDVKRVEQVRREFIANVSHELRTPLAGIKSVLETLESGALRDEKAAMEFVSRADMEVDRLVQLVEELLELSRIESGEVPLARERIDLSAVASGATQRQQHRAQRAGIELTFESAHPVAEIIGDADRLERVVLNLLSNAVKFTPEKGTVRVTCERTGDHATVSVIDSGVGIDPDHVDRVFERFYKADRSRQEGGTGLGLAVVKHTIEAHGGTVGVTSELGGGSTFWFQIPLAPTSGTTISPPAGEEILRTVKRG
jgi:two-component system phosphate regulon sensor histidine kinase PhoR